MFIFVQNLSGTNTVKSALYHLVPQQDFLYFFKVVKDEDKPCEMPQLKLNLKNTPQHNKALSIDLR